MLKADCGESDLGRKITSASKWGGDEGLQITTKDRNSKCPKISQEQLWNLKYNKLCLHSLMKSYF